MSVTDDYKSLRTYNSGPLVIKDKVLVGAGNCSPGHANSTPGPTGMFPPGGCFITGHDLETGKQLWRFNTIAQADEPGGDTWNNLPNEKRGGGAIWVVGQYDPELNLTYWGTGSPSPWSTVTRGTFDAKGLYMNSTLALNPDTGKLVWYYQHIGADPYDQDYAFERIIVPMTFEGKPRKAVITVGKPGIFEAVDAATGQFLFARDPGAQNVATAIDPKTGVKTLLPEPLPDGVTRCPGNIGARNFPAGAYSPTTNRYYLPINDICMGKQGDTHARFLALGLTTLEFAWDIKSRVPQSSAALTTAGGLVFSATPDRYFRAFDDRDGKVLWESPRLNDIPNAFPISYMVDGKQYIAMAVGNTGLQGNNALGTAPELGAVRGAHRRYCGCGSCPEPWASSPPMSHEAIFADVYRRRVWGYEGTVSGPGPTRARAADFGLELADLLRRLDARPSRSRRRPHPSMSGACTRTGAIAARTPGMTGIAGRAAMSSLSTFRGLQGWPQCSASFPPRVFELHGDEVGCAHSVAGGDPLKRFVQGSCRLPIPDRRKQTLRRPARGDLIGDNADAVAGLLRTVSAGERHRA